jgi:hypothetical protein
MKRKFKFVMVIKFLAMFILFATAFGFITMHLWNWLVPVLFHGPFITFCQAIGLLILSKILFGGFKGGRHHGGGCHNRHHHGYWRKRMEERMASMSEEEKEAFRNRCSWPKKQENE